VYLAGNPAENRGTHWLGGPDFAVEIISRHDRTRKKLPFYASVGTGELLVVDRRPWVLELYRRSNDAMELVGKSDAESSSPLSSTVLPLTFRLLPGEPRPRIEVVHTDGIRTWLA
jgi:Uma2 family endonuclease